MTSAQAAAFVNAQSVMMQAELAARVSLEAHTDERYPPEDWDRFVERWDAVLGYNAVIALFNSATG